MIVFQVIQLRTALLLGFFKITQSSKTENCNKYTFLKQHYLQKNGDLHLIAIMIYIYNMILQRLQT